MTLVMWNGHFHVSSLLFATNEWSQLLLAQGLVCCAKCDPDVKFRLSISLYNTLDLRRPWQPLAPVWEGASSAVPRTAAWTCLLTLYVWGCSDHRLTLPHNGSWWGDSSTGSTPALGYWRDDSWFWQGLGTRNFKYLYFHCDYWCTIFRLLSVALKK